MKLLPLAAIALLSLGFGVGVGFAIRQPALSSLERRLSVAEGKLTLAEKQAAESNAKLEELSGTASKTSADLQNLRTQLEQRDQQLTAAQKEVTRLVDLQHREATQPSLAEFSARLAADRSLLLEMRKDPPDDRDEARRLWANIKQTAIQSDASLGPRVDRITRALSVYYNWLAAVQSGTFDSVDEAQNAYVLSGAGAYSSAIDDFWKAVQLVISDRLDVLAKVGK